MRDRPQRDTRIPDKNTRVRVCACVNTHARIRSTSVVRRMRAINRASAVNLTASATATAQCEDGVVYGTEDRAPSWLLLLLFLACHPLSSARARRGGASGSLCPLCRAADDPCRASGILSRGTFTSTVETPLSHFLPAFPTLLPTLLPRAAVQSDRRDAPCS